MNLEKIGNNKIFNFGSDNKISVKELVEKIIFLSGEKSKIAKIEEQRSDEIKAQYVSFNKAVKLLSWNAKTDLTDGIKKTILWYRKYFKHNKN